MSAVEVEILSVDGLIGSVALSDRVGRSNDQTLWMALWRG